MRHAACVLLLLSAGLLPAADPPAPPAPLKVTGETKVPAYKLVRLTAEGLAPGAAVIWDVNDEDKADAEEESGGRLVFVAPPGVYRVKVREIRLDGMQAVVRTARVTVTVGDPPPPPPPPGPPPPPPAPPDPLAAAVKAAYDADPSPLKAVDAASLAAVYRALSAPGAGVNDPAVTTAQQMADVVQKSRAALVGDRLAGERVLFGTEFAKVAPTDPAAPLTAGVRSAAATLLAKFAGILEATK